MLSSISNSDYKEKLIFLFCLTVLIYVAINIFAFELATHHQAALERENTYIVNVKGMNDLMKNIYSASSPDIIFIGNSTTKVQIDSDILQSQNMRVFNYGMLGYTIYHYPQLVKNAIKRKPKVIVISIKEPELYTSMTYLYSAYYHQLDINLSSIDYVMKYIKTQDDWKFLRKITYSYLLAKNYFGLYGYELRKIIKNKVEKFGKLGLIENSNSTGLPIDYCTYPCRNGDYILEGVSNSLKFDSYRRIVNHSRDQYNFTAAAMLNGLIEEIKKAGIRPVILLIPEFTHDVYEDNSLLQKTIHADVIDLSYLDMPNDGWYDYEHLNAKGRVIYSKKVAEKIKPYLKG